MATEAKILGQLAPNGAVLDELYEVPALKRATLRVVAANRSGSDDVFRVAVGINGAADSVEQYLVYDFPIDGNGTLTSAPFAVGAGDVIRVRSTNGSVSFTATGLEQDV